VNAVRDSVRADATGWVNAAAAGLVSAACVERCERGCYSACSHCGELLQSVLSLQRAIAVRAVARATARLAAGATANLFAVCALISLAKFATALLAECAMARLAASATMRNKMHGAHQDASQCVGCCGIWEVELRRAWPCTPARWSGAGSNIPSMKSTGNVFGLRNARRPPELVSPSRRCTEANLRIS
jgi:hypothetical protein